MSTRVAINGFGRIGRNILRAIVEGGRKDIVVVAINDLAPVATNAQAFLMLVDVKTNTGKVRVAIEFVAIAQGRTELTIVSIVQNAVQKVVAQIDEQLARALVARAT